MIGLIGRVWDCLRVYGVGGNLLRAVQSFYEGSEAKVRIAGEISESFEVKVGLRQGCYVAMAV